MVFRPINEKIIPSIFWRTFEMLFSLCALCRYMSTTRIVPILPDVMLSTSVLWFCYSLRLVGTIAFSWIVRGWSLTWLKRIPLLLVGASLLFTKIKADFQLTSTEIIYSVLNVRYTRDIFLVHPVNLKHNKIKINFTVKSIIVSL